MADMETICARLCLLTRAAWKEGLPAPLSRATVRKMIRFGALSGLTLRRVEGIREDHYLRAEALLSRSVEVFIRVQYFLETGYRVVLPEDACWPKKLYVLGQHMPQFLFVQGNRSLFACCSVALAGSRKISTQTYSLACKCGEEIGKAGYVMVSGGASGVDSAAQKSLLNAGGRLILVPAFPVDTLLHQHYLQEALEAGRLLLVCDTWPDEEFSAAKALARNHTIYALGDAALVVASRRRIGGSWRGAMDCLKSGYTPVFALDRNGADYAGNQALFDLGAYRFDISLPIADQLFLAGRMKDAEHDADHSDA